MSLGLLALKVLLRLLVGALFWGFTRGNFRFVLVYTLVASLTASLLLTIDVLMIWIDSGGALCLLLISRSGKE